MRCGGVEDGGVLLQKHHAVQAVGVAGTVDLFNGLALLFCRLGQPLHQGRFAAARPAFDEIHLHPRFVAQRFKIALEPGGRRGPKEKINGIVSKIRHGKHLTFALGYAKCGVNATRKGTSSYNLSVSLALASRPPSVAYATSPSGRRKSFLVGEPLAKPFTLRGLPRPPLQGEVAMRSIDGEVVGRRSYPYTA